MPADRHWEHFEHGADIGLAAEADSREAMFEAMGEALTGVVTEPAGVRGESAVDIACEAPDDALLLADWLNALIYEMATRHMLFADFRVRFEGRRLTATAIGEQVERPRHRPAVEVKGATYTDLAVLQDEAGRWYGRCIVDV